MVQKKILFLSLSALTFGLEAENLIRNGNFEYGTKFNGSIMRCGDFDTAATIYSTQKTSNWIATPFNGWWLNGKRTASVSVISDSNHRKMSLKGQGILESDHRPVPKNAASLTLSFDVKTSGAEGQAVLNLMKNNSMFQHPVFHSKKLELPLNTDGKFRHVSLSLEIPQNADRTKLLTGMKIELKKGEFALDNVQIEPGNSATAFRPRRGEWLKLTMDDFPLENLPRYYADGKGVKPAGKRTLSIQNTSGGSLTGTLNVYRDSWKNPGKTRIAEFRLENWGKGEKKSLVLEPGKWAPDGWIILAEWIAPDGTVLVPIQEIFDPKRTGNGSIGRHMLTQYNGLRIAVFPGIEKRNTFGVGNGMVGTSQHWGGFELINYTLAREAGVTGLLGSATEEGQLFHCAIAGAQQYGGFWIDGASKNPAWNNPSVRNALDIFSEGGRKELKERAETLGKELALGPGVNGVKLRNESVYFNGSGICPTPAADEDFRQWCKKRHQTLKELNRRWGTAYKNWSEVKQIISSDMIELAKVKEKKGAEAIDWFANMGKMTKDTVNLMKANPGQAMDWLRWMTDSSLRMYNDFIQTAKKYDKETLYGTNLCWPNFWPQMAMRFYRSSDAPMLDLQYSAGHGKDLGNSDEMLDMLEMAESTVPGKPVWGIEIYVQPSFTAEFPALQNWAMLAHGMTNNLVFAWKPYSDHGPSVFKSGTNSWKLPKSPAMWMLIDTDGTKLPLWYSNLRSAEEIAKFHKKYDALSLKRPSTRTGWYLAPDTAELVVFHTANNPYDSGLVSARTSQAAQLRLAGARLNYLDDETLGTISTKNYDTVLLPPTPVLSDKAAKQLASFVKQGGTLVLLGPVGNYDPWLKHREFFGGKEWAELQWKTPKHWMDIDNFISDYNASDWKEEGLSRNPEMPLLPKSRILKNAKGIELAREIRWGKGRLIAAQVYPKRYTQFAHVSSELRDYMNWLVSTAGIKCDARWVAAKENTPEDLKSRVGHGNPIVELVFRDKSPKERFLFLLNQGGAGSGTIYIPGLNSDWKIEDALSGKPVSGSFDEKGWSLRTDVAPWQYFIFRIFRTK